MRTILWVLATAIGAAACQGGSEEDEARAALAVSQARDLEYDPDTLTDAIRRYREIEREHGNTPSGKSAGTRADALSDIVPLVPLAVTSEADSAAELCDRILDRAPDYPPVMVRSAQLRYNATKLWARAVPKMGDLFTPEKVMKIWQAQDSLFSKYPFRANPSDRDLGDLLCRQSVDVARMLEGMRRYTDALDVVNRGLVYGKGQDAVNRAKVYGAFYNYRNGKNTQAIEMASDAAAYEHLTDKLKARAHHVRGMAYFSVYEETGRIEDLDKSIDALNAAVDIDGSMSEARAMLRELRSARGRLVTPAS